MAKDNNKNMSVFSDVIKSLAFDAAMGVEGVIVLRGKDSFRKSVREGGASVEFLPNERVNINLTVNVHFGFTVPALVAAVQEKVKAEVEGSTKYHVHSINVHVKDVLPQ